MTKEPQGEQISVQLSKMIMKKMIVAQYGYGLIRLFLLLDLPSLALFWQSQNTQDEFLINI